MATIGAQADYGLIRPIETALDRQMKVAQIRQANQQYRLTQAQAYDDDRKKKSLVELMQNSRDPATGQINKEAIIQGAYGIDPNLGAKLDQQWTPEIEAQKRKAAIQEAYKGSIKGDGTYDENMLFSKLMQVDPELANSAVSKIRDNFSSLLKNDLERKSLLVNPLSAVKDENDYESIKVMARMSGIGNSDLPDEYDPEAVKKYIEKYKDPAAKHKEFEDAMNARKLKNEEKNTAINQGRLDEEIRSNKANESTARMNALNKKEEDKGSLFGGLSGTYANSDNVKGTLINGLSLIPNTLISKESVNKTKAAYDTYLNIKKQIESLKEQYNKNKTELIGNKAEVMKATVRGIQLSLKELENLGVLNGPDLSLMEQMVPNPTGISGTARGLLNPILGDKIIPMLDNLQKRIDTKLDANLRVNGFTRSNNKSAAPSSDNDPLGIR